MDLCLRIAQLEAALDAERRARQELETALASALDYIREMRSRLQAAVRESQTPRPGRGSGRWSERNR